MHINNEILHNKCKPASSAQLGQVITCTFVKLGSSVQLPLPEDQNRHKGNRVWVFFKSGSQQMWLDWTLTQSRKRSFAWTVGRRSSVHRLVGCPDMWADDLPALSGWNAIPAPDLGNLVAESSLLVRPGPPTSPVCFAWEGEKGVLRLFWFHEPKESLKSR